MRHGLSIRLRLTLLYSAILALTLLAFSTALYATQARATYGSIKANLQRQAAFAANDRGRPPGPPAGFPLPEERGLLVAQLPSGTLSGRWIQIRSLDGAVTGQTFDLSGTSLPLSEKGLAAVQVGEGWFETVEVQDEPLLVFSRPYEGPGGVLEIIQVAFPIAETERSLSILRLILLVGSSLVIAAAFAVGWVLSGEALRPIQRITQTAQAIGAEHNFARRVQHAGPNDEVGQLAVTFNEMLSRLESGYRQLESALHSQRRFVADASHELRTPLTTVRGNIELLRHEPPIDSTERAEVLADTIDEVERLIRLVNQLLVLARADAGLTLRREPVALGPLIEDVYRQAKLIGSRQLVLRAPGDGGVAAMGDRDALKQVVLILIENGLVHTAPGTVIELATDSQDGSAVVCVSDSGPGIAPDVLPHIFERFYQGEASRSGAGSGLGLAIAKELVENQGGTLSVESELGRGSVFTVRLPPAPAQC